MTKHAAQDPWSVGWGESVVEGRVPCTGCFLSAPWWTRVFVVPMSYRQIAKERFMRPITGFVVAALAVLSLAGCSTTASNNTTYARPPASSGLQIPLN
jgi:hypothetical protein